MELKVINDKGEAQKGVEASDQLFGRDYNESLVHQVVIAYAANGRQGAQARRAAKCATRRRSRGAKEGSRAALAPA
jgi:large subunit ribosomal protein L4